MAGKARPQQPSRPLGQSRDGTHTHSCQAAGALGWVRLRGTRDLTAESTVGNLFCFASLRRPRSSVFESSCLPSYFSSQHVSACPVFPVLRPTQRPTQTTGDTRWLNLTCIQSRPGGLLCYAHNPNSLPLLACPNSLPRSGRFHQGAGGAQRRAFRWCCAGRGVYYQRWWWRRRRWRAAALARWLRRVWRPATSSL